MRPTKKSHDVLRLALISGLVLQAPIPAAAEANVLSVTSNTREVVGPTTNLSQRSILQPPPNELSDPANGVPLISPPNDTENSPVTIEKWLVAGANAAAGAASGAVVSNLDELARHGKLVVTRIFVVDPSDDSGVHSEAGSLHGLVYTAGQDDPGAQQEYKDYLRHVYLIGPSPLSFGGWVAGLHPFKGHWGDAWPREWLDGDQLTESPYLELFSWSAHDWENTPPEQRAVNVFIYESNPSTIFNRLHTPLLNARNVSLAETAKGPYLVLGPYKTEKVSETALAKINSWPEEIRARMSGDHPSRIAVELLTVPGDVVTANEDRK